MQFGRTDLAVEFAPGVRHTLSERIARTDVAVDEKLSKQLSKPVGRYSTVETDIVVRGDRTEYGRLVEALSNILAELRTRGSCMCVGLGNPLMTADALGTRCARRLCVGRGSGLCSVTPNVSGATGIESADIVAGAVERVKPDSVVVVDSLAAAATGRLGAAFQFTDSGITPGSGVANHRTRLDRDSLGVPVLSIGVPLVVYASTIVEEAGGDPAAVDSLIVTPKDIDVLVEDCAEVIAAAINRVFVGI